MPSKNCVILNCDTTYKDKTTIRHLFPRDETRFKIWIQCSGNPKLNNFSIDEVYRSFVVRVKHFENNCKSPGTKKLNRNAIPTLMLPNLPNGLYHKLMFCEMLMCHKCMYKYSSCLSKIK